MRTIALSLFVSIALVPGCSTGATGDGPAGADGTGGTDTPDASGGASAPHGMGGQVAAGGSGGGAPAAGTGGSPAAGGSDGGALGSGGDGAGGSAGSEHPDASAPDTGEPPPAGAMVKLFDGATLAGWDGNPMIWSVKDGAIDGLSKTGGQLIYTKGDYDSFRLILESRLVSNTQHLGVCFWGERSPTWGYANCILVIPPSGGMWDYHKGIKSPPHQNPAKASVAAGTWHTSEILANATTGTVTMAVNGIVVLTYKNMTGLKKAPIGLQIHNGSSEVQYRGLMIEESPKDDKLVTVKP
jgi:hypothetical protein